MPIQIHSEVELIAASCSDDARISRAALAARLSLAGIEADLGSRHEADALKVALKKLLNQVGSLSYQENGQTQKGRLVSVSTPMKGGVRVDVHMKKADDQGKNFLLVGTILWETGGQPFWFSASQEMEALLPKQIVEVLRDCPALVAYGQATCFDTDLRSLVGDVMTANRKFWAGTFLIVGRDEIERAENLGEVLKGLDGGTVRLASLVITPNEKSIQTIREDMGLALVGRLGEVRAELENMPKGKVLRRLGDQFEQIEREVRRLEGQLGILFGQDMENALDEIRLGLLSLNFQPA